MRAKALFEVIGVFSLTLLLIVGVSISPVGEWERRVTQRPFLEYALMIAAPLLLLVVGQRNLAEYGLTLRHVKYQFDMATTCLIPVAIACIPFAFLDYRRWDGALALAGIQIALLFALGRLLESKPTANEQSLLAACGLVGLASKATVGNALSAFVFYLFFLGTGEELLFRGYIQSRLNSAFQKPFEFYGVRWGWGLVITSALFGSMHVLNGASLIVGNWQPMWWWGFWTFFSGLVLGWVREKTGGLIAPVLLHGLPQALAYAFLGL